MSATVSSVGCGRTAKTNDDDDVDPGVDTTKPPTDKPNCAVAIDGREGRHCAVYQDGTVWCWGIDWPKQPSDFQPTSAPTKVEGVEQAERVTVGPRHSCALAGKRLVCWGDNESGQIDDSGAATLPPTPLQISWDSVSPIRGFALADRQTCALNFLAHAYCRGEQAGVVKGSQQVTFAGPPLTTMPGPYPYLVDDAGRIFELQDWANPVLRDEYGDDNAWFMRGIPNCLLKRSGSLWCDSDNAATPNDEMFVVANLGERVIQAAIGQEFWCAVSDGKVWCKGKNAEGQTATGNQDDRAPGHFIAGLEDVRSISLNNYSGCALKGDGSVWCWGKDTNGKLRLTPERVSGCEKQLTPPFKPSMSSPPGPSSLTHLAEAGLARAQAMCVCAFGEAADDSCIKEENAAPNQDCMATLAADDGARHECRASAWWQDAECFAQQACPGNVIDECPTPPVCPPPKTRGVENYCRRITCALDFEAVLTKDQICDGTNDCTDGSDERNCGGNLGGSFECNPETRILVSKLCDAVPDCNDGSDEQYCGGE